MQIHLAAQTYAQQLILDPFAHQVKGSHTLHIATLLSPHRASKVADTLPTTHITLTCQGQESCDSWPKTMTILQSQFTRPPTHLQHSQPEYAVSTTTGALQCLTAQNLAQSMTYLSFLFFFFFFSFILVKDNRSYLSYVSPRTGRSS